MNDTPSKQPATLGAALRQAREEHGLSIRQLVAASGVPQTAIVRLERDEVDRPEPGHLAKLAHVLELEVSDLFVLAGWPLPQNLPNLAPYLRAKYGLSDAATAELQAAFENVRRKYGADKEDQSPE